MARTPRPRSNQLPNEFRKATVQARQLSSAVSGVNKGIVGAISSAGNLAEQFALISRNAKLAAGAAGIGAIVSIGVSMVQIWKQATDQMKQFNQALNRVGADTKIAALQGRGRAAEMEARKEAIQAAVLADLAAADKTENKDQREILRQAIIKRGREEAAALEREAVRSRDQSFRLSREELADRIKLSEIEKELLNHPNSRAAQRMVGRMRNEVERDSKLRQLDVDAEREGYTANQIRALRDLIVAEFDSANRVLDAELTAQARQVGETFVSTLADAISTGISIAIQSGNIGAGFKALTGGILMGLGDMLQTIGEKGLLASKLMADLVAAIARLDPVTGIAASLALIAAGGALKGLGASMGGRGGGASSGYTAPSSFGRTTYVGVVNPSGSAPTTAGLAPVAPVTVHAVIIGKDDPNAQRELLDLFSRAQRRGRPNG